MCWSGHEVICYVFMTTLYLDFVLSPTADGECNLDPDRCNQQIPPNTLVFHHERFRTGEGLLS